MISKTRQCGLRRPKTVKANTEKSKAGKVRKRPSLRRGEGCSQHFEVGSLEVGYGGQDFWEGFDNLGWWLWLWWCTKRGAGRRKVEGGVRGGQYD